MRSKKLNSTFSLGQVVTVAGIASALALNPNHKEAAEGLRRLGG